MILYEYTAANSWDEKNIGRMRGSTRPITNLNVSIEAVVPAEPITVTEKNPTSPLWATLSVELDIFKVTLYKPARTNLWVYIK